MLPITTLAQRFRVIDQSLPQLPQVLNHIIADYDEPFEEVRQIIKSIDFEEIPTPLFFEQNRGSLPKIEDMQDNPAFVKLRELWWHPDPPVDVTLELFDKFCQGYPLAEKFYHQTRYFDVFMLLAWSPDGQLPKVHCSIEKRGTRNKGEYVLHKLVGSKEPGLTLKNGDMSHRSYIQMNKIFVGAVFVNMNFTGTRFNSVKMMGVSFINCNLTNVTFDECNLRLADFSGSLLKNTKFRNLEDLSEAKFNSVIFEKTAFIHNDYCSPIKTYHCYAVKASDWLFLAKLKRYSNLDPTPHIAFRLYRTSFQYTPPRIMPPQSLECICPIL